MECRICENDNKYVHRSGKIDACYHIEFKNKLGFWCKYRRSHPSRPGALFVVTYLSRESAECTIKRLQNGQTCNEGPSMIMVSVIMSLLVTTLILCIIAVLQSGV
jgi:hypothetical protein